MSEIGDGDRTTDPARTRERGMAMEAVQRVAGPGSPVALVDNGVPR